MSNPEQIHAFVNALFDPGEWVELRAFKGSMVERQWFTAANADALAKWAIDANDRGFNCYAGVNPRTRRGGGKAEHVATVRTLFTDFDGQHVAGITDPDEQVRVVLDRIAAKGLPTPAIVNSTGHGVHTYWLLDAPLTDLATWKRCMAALVGVLGSDDVVKDLARILRLPGLVNHKPPVATARLIRCEPTSRVSFDAIADVVFNSADADEPEQVAASLRQFNARPARTGGNAGVIDAFNQRVDLRELLTSYGYDVRGRMFRRPDKTDPGFSGVIRRDKRGRDVVAAFSTNDKLNDGRFADGAAGLHDCFGAWCILEHGGSESAAVRAAAELLGIPRQRGRSDDLILADLLRGESGQQIRQLLATPTPQTRQQIRVLIGEHTSFRSQADRLLDRVMKLKGRAA